MRLADIAAHWPTLLTAIGGLGAGSILKTLLDHRRGMRRATDEVAMGLVAQLRERIVSLEAGAAQERALCEARLALLRHRVNNLAGAFDSIVLLIKAAPERAAELIKLVEDMRARQETAEAVEKAALQSAIIAAVSPHAPASAD